MFACLYKGVALFVTPFDNKYNLVQKFRGLDKQPCLTANFPVDFMESGLMQKDKWDCWHIDVPFAICTDEATPCFVNGSYIGANHGGESAVKVICTNHQKTFADIGSLWQDQTGTQFTLVRVEDEDCLLFLSQNLGKSLKNYAFKRQIDGELTFVGNGENKNPILAESQVSAELIPTNRYLQKQVYVYVDGVKTKLYGSKQCDYAQIYESYQIINPATVTDDLRAKRPNGGYSSNVNLADFGSPMITANLTYTINPDGAVITEFDYKSNDLADFNHFMGVMFQEKLDVYGGGIYRYIPKILPFETAEGVFDFSKPYPILNAPYPKDEHLCRDKFNDNGSPTERCVDYFRDTNGVDKLGFACGFLPLFDGQPSIRDKSVNEVWHAKKTRKFYPMFCDVNVTDFKGVGYKKYFIPTENKGGYYTVDYGNQKFIYVDLFECKNCTINLANPPILLEQQNAEYNYSNGVLTVSANSDCSYAVFKTQI